MGGFSYGIPLAVTPEQIAAAVEQRGGTYTPSTLTQTVTATPAPAAVTVFGTSSNAGNPFPASDAQA